MDTTALHDAYQELLAAADAAAGTAVELPAGEWNAEQILAHVSIVNAATIAAVCAVASGSNTTYDNRAAQDAWTIQRVVDRSGSAVRERIRSQGDALCLLGATLGEAELDTAVPTLLLSDEQVLVDQPLRLRDIISGLADGELPGHTKQLLALLP